MEFSSCGIISFSGGDGGIEIAEILAPAIVPNCSAKPALVLSIPDAFVAGTILPPARVPGVLSNRRKTKIRPSIVQAIAIDVVNDEAIAYMAMAVLSSEF